MPAPTALQRAPEKMAEEVEREQSVTDLAPAEDGAAPVLDPIAVLPSTSTATESAAAAEDTEMAVDLESRPNFGPAGEVPSAFRKDSRQVLVPPHRMTPLKQNWSKIYPPLVEHLKLQVRMNPGKKAIELRTSKSTTDEGALQKGCDFCQAFCLGFDVDDSIALLRLDEMYLETFELKDIKTLGGEHKSRAIGRIAGKDGKTKFAIENASRTRIVVQDQKISILGAFKNIAIARSAISSLVLGAPPGKVYGNLRTVAARMKERF